MDETPEQRAIEEKRQALCALEDERKARRRTRARTIALSTRKRLPMHELADDAEPSIGPRLLHLVLSLFLLVVVGLPMWWIYGDVSGSVAIFGNCGPEGFLGRGGHYVGGSAASWPAATVIGAILVVAGGAAAWISRRTAIVLFMFAWLYLMALSVLAIIASRIWGPRHCVLY
jgi:hypothetical protein